MSSSTDNPLPLSHVLETCLYVKSAPKAAEFYANAFGVKPVFVTVSLRSTKSFCLTRQGLR